MRIFVVGSMQFSEKMVEVREALKAMGHDAVCSAFVESFLGKTDEEKEVIKLEQKNNENAMLIDCRQILGGDAVLVLNFDKHGVKNYIGGNVLIELGFAHILKQKIFLYNPVPEIAYYQTEIEAMKPVILNGDLSLVK